MASCASVQGQYEPPVEGVNEVAELKKIIRMLEDRRPCYKCGGKGFWWEPVTSTHHATTDCGVCNGKGWI